MVVAVLYFARDVLIPVALAVLFSFLLAPLVTRLRRRGWWRTPAVLSVVSLSFVLMAVVGFVMFGQLADLSHKLPEYRHNIHQKLQSIRDSSSGILGRISNVTHNVSKELKVATPSPSAPDDQKPVPVQIQQSEFSPLAAVPKILGSVFGLLLTAVIVVVFVIFMLMEQQDLRDRVIRLIGWRQLNVTTKALDEAGQRVSRYLLAQLCVNAGFGVAVGVALYFLSVPNPVLWAVIVALLRYIPYLGTWIAAAMPAAVVFAIDPSWLKPVAIFGIYGGIDLLMYNFVEPFVYGNTTGLTPLAILVAAVFWTWLWGPVGLLLATPLTVCLAVMGRYVPSLRFLGVLLSDEEVLTPEKRFYQRLLADDVEEATDIAETFLKEKTLDELYDEVIVPALGLAAADRRSGQLAGEEAEFVFHNARLLVEDVGGRAHENDSEGGLNRRMGGDACVLSLPARGEADEIAALMLAQLLNRRGIGAKAVSASALASERLDEASQQGIELVCVSTVLPDGCLQARYLCKRLREQCPEMRIVAAVIVCGEGGNRERDVSAYTNALAVKLSDAVRQVQSLIPTPARSGQTAFSS